MKRITTENGSVYLIDEENKTWERVSSSAASGKIRTNAGSIKNDHPLDIRIGHPVTIWTDNVNIHADYRVLHTSHVVKIESL